MDIIRTLGEIFDVWVIAALLPGVVALSYIILRMGREDETPGASPRELFDGPSSFLETEQEKPR